MAKRTAIIDIGSNSVRLVIFEKTSRFAFHLLHEEKSRVRISENAYENKGVLQEIPLERTYNALKEFTYIIKHHKATKVLCVATSALRDAPNNKDFISKVYKNLDLKIKLISGEKEAYYGGMAAANLLHLDSALTVDIGGGSTELSLYEQKKISHTISLNLGTVRLKELYLDNKDISGAKAYITNELSNLPTLYKHHFLVGIGGTIRALTKAIMLKEKTYYRKIHGFCFDIKEQQGFLEGLIDLSKEELLALGFKEERLDVLIGGILILLSIIECVGSQRLLTSGVGVREGLFLSDLLRSQRDCFPHNYNPSLTSLLDRFDSNNNGYLNTQAERLFNLCAPYLKLDNSYKDNFLKAIKLSQIGKKLDYYEAHRHAYYKVLNALGYALSHQEIVLIATLVRYQRKKQAPKQHIQNYKNYLPDIDTCANLSYLMRLSVELFSNFKQNIPIQLEIKDKTLVIKAENSHLLKESLSDLRESSILKVEFL